MYCTTYVSAHCDSMKPDSYLRSHVSFYSHTWFALTLVSTAEQALVTSVGAGFTVTSQLQTNLQQATQVVRDFFSSASAGPKKLSQLVAALQPTLTLSGGYDATSNALRYMHVHGRSLFSQSLTRSSCAPMCSDTTLPCPHTPKRLYLLLPHGGAYAHPFRLTARASTSGAVPSVPATVAALANSTLSSLFLGSQGGLAAFTRDMTFSGSYNASVVASVAFDSAKLVGSWWENAAMVASAASVTVDEFDAYLNFAAKSAQVLSWPVGEASVSAGDTAVVVELGMFGYPFTQPFGQGLLSYMPYEEGCINARAGLLCLLKMYKGSVMQACNAPTHTGRKPWAELARKARAYVPRRFAPARAYTRVHVHAAPHHVPNFGSSSLSQASSRSSFRLP